MNEYKRTRQIIWAILVADKCNTNGLFRAIELADAKMECLDRATKSWQAKGHEYVGKERISLLRELLSYEDKNND